MRYMKKPEPPVYVEAFKWENDSEEPPKWFKESVQKNRVTLQHAGTDRVQLSIIHPSGIKIAVPGVWIVLEENGTIDFRTDEEFATGYEDAKEGLKDGADS